MRAYRPLKRMGGGGDARPRAAPLAGEMGMGTVRYPL